MNRPFQNYKTPITDPSYFVGRKTLLQTMERDPFNVWILLGGRRIGKTSTLNALRWNFLSLGPAFPVFIDLQKRQPQSTANVRWILARSLDTAITEWQQTQRNLPVRRPNTTLAKFTRQIGNTSREIWAKTTLSTPSWLPFKATYTPSKSEQLDEETFEQRLRDRIIDLHKLNFEGICFLLDEVDTILNHPWVNTTFWYLRGLKSDERFTPVLGLVLAGFKTLKTYEQKVSSPLRNIAEIQWLDALDPQAAQDLIRYRQIQESIQLADLALLEEWSGYHPYLLQQLVNAFSDAPSVNSPESTRILLNTVIRQQNDIFKDWWQNLSDLEQEIYRILMQERQIGITELKARVSKSENATVEALEVLQGTGIISKIETDLAYTIRARLFEEWVIKETMPANS